MKAVLSLSPDLAQLVWAKRLAYLRARSIWEATIATQEEDDAVLSALSATKVMQEDRARATME